MVIHEVTQVLWVETPHGDGIVLFLIDYGPHENTIWCVALESDGRILHYNSNQLRFCKNSTFEIRRHED